MKNIGLLKDGHGQLKITSKNLCSGFYKKDLKKI